MLLLLEKDIAVSLRRPLCIVDLAGSVCAWIEQERLRCLILILHLLDHPFVLTDLLLNLVLYLLYPCLLSL